MKAIRAHRAGGPEVLVYEDVPDPIRGPGQALVKIEVAGENFGDSGPRRNLVAGQAIGIGAEAAGTVLSVAPDVTVVKPGDRVVFTGVPGAFAEMIAAPADRLVPIPEGVSPKMAAASLAQGMTAHYLACDTYALGSNDTCLVHAAAGGVGLMLCQIAKMRGARVIGTVSTAEKAQAAREAGADEVILYTQVPFDEEVRRLTNGRGVDVVYDSVGRSTFLQSLNSLRPRGLIVMYGTASGPVEPFDTALLAQRGSLYLTRAGLQAYTATREALLARAGEVFDWVASGKLRVRIHAEYPLAEAAKAQEAVESRSTIGKVLIIV